MNEVVSNRRTIRWKAEGEGPTVILVPGLGSGSRLFGTLPRRFARSGFRCVTFDPVGVAPSAPLEGAFSFDQAARDLLAVADAARDDKPYAIVGTSLGGKVTLQATTLEPTGLQSIVLLASSALVTSRARRVYSFFESVANHMPGDQIGPVTAPFLFGRTFHEVRSEVVDDIVRATQPDADARAFMATQARALQDFDGVPAASACSLPALCIAGLEDTLTEASEVEATAKLLSRGRYLPIANAGHSLMLEQAEVFEAVAGFLGDTLGTA